MGDTVELIAANLVSGVIAASGDTDPVKAVETYYSTLEELKRQIALRSEPAHITNKPPGF